MKLNDYLMKIQQSAINEQAVGLIEKKYKVTLEPLLQKIVSIDSQGVFFDDLEFCRKLSLHEILNADNDLHVDFSNAGLIPLFDIGENDFIAYDNSNKIFCLFNINDEIIFKKNTNLLDLLRKN